MVTNITGGNLTGGTVDIDNPLLHSDPPHSTSQRLPASRNTSLDDISGARTPDEDHESCFDSDSDSDCDVDASIELQILQEMISRDVSGEINTQKLVEELQNFHLCIPKSSTTLSVYAVYLQFMDNSKSAKMTLIAEKVAIMLDHPELAHDPPHVSFYELQIKAIGRALLVLDVFERVLSSQQQIYCRDSCHADRRSTATRFFGSQDTNLLIGNRFISAIVRPSFDLMEYLIKEGFILKNPDRNLTRNGPTLARPVPAPGLFSDASGLEQRPVTSPRQLSAVGAFHDDPPSYYDATNPRIVTNTVIRNVGNLAGGGYGAFVGSTNFDHNLTTSRPSSNAPPLIPLSYSGFNCGNVTNMVIEGVGNTTTVSVTENDGVQYTLSSTTTGGHTYSRSRYQ